MKALFVSSNADNVSRFDQFFSTIGWETLVVDSVNTAAKLFSDIRYDLIFIVPDTDEPGKAFKLLDVLKAKCPDVVRIAIIAADLVNLRQQASLVTHQIFAADCSKDDLIEFSQNVKTGRNVLNKQALLKKLQEIKTLPSPPKVYLRLNALLHDPTTDSRKVSEVIAQDSSLVAKVLQFSNSSFLAKGKTITSIEEAITRIGADTLSCIVMTAELFAYEPNIPGFSLADEQKHSLLTAKLVSTLVNPELKPIAMLAGLLHSLGKVVLYELNPQLTKSYFKQRDESQNFSYQLEQKVLGIDHAQIAGYLLHLWGFSYQIIDAVISHNKPDKLRRKKFDIAAATYVANQLLSKQPLDPALVAHFKLTSVLDKINQRAEKLLAS